MREFPRYFRELQEKCGIKNYTELAAMLGVSRSMASKMRIRGTISNEHCVTIAQALRIDPMELVALNELEKSSRQKVKRYWASKHRESAILKNRQPVI